MQEGNTNPVQDQPAISVVLAAGAAPEVSAVHESGESPGLTGRAPHVLTCTVTATIFSTSCFILKLPYFYV